MEIVAVSFALERVLTVCARCLFVARYMRSAFAKRASHFVVVQNDNIGGNFRSWTKHFFGASWCSACLIWVSSLCAQVSQSSHWGSGGFVGNTYVVSSGRLTYVINGRFEIRLLGTRIPIGMRTTCVCLRGDGDV